MALRSDDVVIKQGAPAWPINSFERLKDALVDYLNGNPATLNAIDPQGVIQRDLRELFERASLGATEESAQNNNIYTQNVLALSRYVFTTRAYSTLQTALATNGDFRANSEKLAALFSAADAASAGSAKSPVQVAIENLDAQQNAETIVVQGRNRLKKLADDAKLKAEQAAAALKAQTEREEREAEERAKRLEDERLEALRRIRADLERAQKASLQVFEEALTRDIKLRDAEMAKYEARAGRARIDAEKAAAALSESQRSLVVEVLVALDLAKYLLERAAASSAGFSDADKAKIAAKLADLNRAGPVTVDSLIGKDGKQADLSNQLAGLKQITELLASERVRLAGDLEQGVKLAAVTIAERELSPANLQAFAEAAKAAADEKTAAAIRDGAILRASKADRAAAFEMYTKLRALSARLAEDEWRTSSLKALEDYSARISELVAKDPNTEAPIKTLSELIAKDIEAFAVELQDPTLPASTMLARHSYLSMCLSALDIALDASKSSSTLPEATQKSFVDLASRSQERLFRLAERASAVAEANEKAAALGKPGSSSAKASEISAKKVERFAKNMANLSGRVDRMKRAAKLTLKDAARTFAMLAARSNELSALVQPVKLFDRENKDLLAVVPDGLTLELSPITGLEPGIEQRAWQRILNAADSTADYNRIMAAYKVIETKRAADIAAGAKPKANQLTDPRHDLLVREAAAAVKRYDAELAAMVERIRKGSAAVGKSLRSDPLHKRLVEAKTKLIGAERKKKSKEDKLEDPSAPLIAPGKNLSAKAISRQITNYEEGLKEWNAVYDQYAALVRAKYAEAQQRSAKREKDPEREAKKASMKVKPFAPTNTHGTIAEMLFGKIDAMEMAAKKAPEGGVPSEELLALQGAADETFARAEIAERMYSADAADEASDVTVGDAQDELEAMSERWTNPPERLTRAALDKKTDREIAELLVVYCRRILDSAKGVRVASTYLGSETAVARVEVICETARRTLSSLEKLARNIPPIAIADPERTRALKSFRESANRLRERLLVVLNVVQGHWRFKAFAALSKLAHLCVTSSDVPATLRQCLGASYELFVPLFGKRIDAAVDAIRKFSFFKYAPDENTEGTALPTLGDEASRFTPIIDLDFSQSTVQAVIRAITELEKRVDALKSQPVRLAQNATKSLAPEVVLPPEEQAKIAGIVAKYEALDIAGIREALKEEHEKDAGALINISIEAYKDAFDEIYKRRETILKALTFAMMLFEDKKPHLEALARNVIEARYLADRIEMDQTVADAEALGLLEEASVSYTLAYEHNFADVEKLFAENPDPFPLTDVDITAADLPDTFALPIASDINAHNILAGRPEVEDEEELCWDALQTLARRIYDTEKDSILPWLHIFVDRPRASAPLTTLYRRLCFGKVLARCEQGIRASALCSEPLRRKEILASVRAYIEAVTNQIALTVARLTNGYTDVRAEPENPAALRTAATFAMPKARALPANFDTSAVKRVHVSVRPKAIMASRTVSTLYASYLLDEPAMTRLINVVIPRLAKRTVDGQADQNARAALLYDAVDYYILVNDFITVKTYLSVTSAGGANVALLKSTPALAALMARRKNLRKLGTRMMLNVRDEGLPENVASDYNELARICEEVSVQLDASNALRHPGNFIRSGAVITRAEADQQMTVFIGANVFADADEEAYKEAVSEHMAVLDAQPPPLPSKPSPVPPPSSTPAGSAPASTAPVLKAPAGPSAATLKRLADFLAASVARRNALAGQFVALSGAASAYAAIAQKVTAAQSASMDKLNAFITIAQDAGATDSKLLPPGIEDDFEDSAKLAASSIATLQAELDARKSADNERRVFQSALTATKTRIDLVSKSADELEKRRLAVKGVPEDKAVVSALDAARQISASAEKEVATSPGATSADIKEQISELDKASKLITAAGVQLDKLKKAIEKAEADELGAAEAARKKAEEEKKRKADEDAAAAATAAAKLKADTDAKLASLRSAITSATNQYGQLVATLNELQEREAAEGKTTDVDDAAKVKGSGIAGLIRQVRDISDKPGLALADYERGLALTSTILGELRNYEALIEAYRKKLDELPAKPAASAPAPEPAAQTPRPAPAAAGVTPIDLSSVKPAADPVPSSRGRKLAFMSDAFESAAEVGEELKSIATSQAALQPTAEERAEGKTHGVYLYVGLSDSKSLAVLFVPVAPEEGAPIGTGKDRFSVLNAVKDSLTTYTDRWNNKPYPPNSLPIMRDRKTVEYIPLVVITYTPVLNRYLAEIKSNSRLPVPVTDDSVLKTVFKTLGDRLYSGAVTSGASITRIAKDSFTHKKLLDWIYGESSGKKKRHDIPEVEPISATPPGKRELIQLNTSNPLGVNELGRLVLDGILGKPVEKGRLVVDGPEAKKQLLEYAGHVIYHGAPGEDAQKEKEAASRAELIEARLAERSDPLSEASDWGDSGLSDGDDAPISSSLPGKLDASASDPNVLPSGWDE